MSETTRFDNIQANKSSSIFSDKFIAKSIICFISLILLLLALFSPLAYSNVTADDGYEYTLEVTTFDNINFAFCSLFAYSEQSLAEMDAFENAAELSTNSLREQFKYSDKSNDSFKKLFTLTLMNRRAPVRITILVNGLVSVIYIILCLILFVNALRDLFFEMLSKLGKTAPMQNISEKTEHFLRFLLLALPFFFFSNIAACNLGYTNIFLGIKTLSSGISFGFILSVILLLLANAFIVWRHVVNFENGPIAFAKRIRVKDIICLACGVVFIMSAFLPCVSMSIARIDGRRMSKEAEFVSFADLFEISSHDIHYYKEESSEFAISLMDKILADAPSSFDQENELFYYCLCKRSSNSAKILFLAITLVNLISLIIFAGLFSGITDRLLNSTQIKKMKFKKILLTLVSCVQFVLCWLLTMLSMTLGSSWQIDGSVYNIVFDIGLAPVLSLICCVVLLFVLEEKKQKEIDASYDNPDVSSTPYIFISADF